MEKFKMKEVIEEIKNSNSEEELSLYSFIVVKLFFSFCFLVTFFGLNFILGLVK